MAKITVILANLGSPKAPTTEAVSEYLKQFLSDIRVIDFPRPWWHVILKAIRIKRAPRVAKTYQSIWTNEGSPLIKISHIQQQALLSKLQAYFPEHEFTVEVGMSYQEPNLTQVTSKVFKSKPDHVILLPLYPQFSSTTTLSVIDAFNKAYTPHQQRFVPPFTIVNNYHDHPLYIRALANSVREHILKTTGTNIAPKDYFSAQHKLFISNHAVPVRYVEQMHDPYQLQCERTTELLVQELGLSSKQYQATYQSVFGKEPWLTPQTNYSLEEHARLWKDKAQATVISPCFSVDCLETIEENGEENKEIFQAAGGKDYYIIPCLNDRDDHIAMMFAILRKHIELL